MIINIIRAIKKWKQLKANRKWDKIKHKRIAFTAEYSPKVERNPPSKL